jgi:hypothetical protein
MNQAQLINNVRNASAQTLRLIEQAQAVAAAELQEYTKLGGATFLAEYNWEGTEVTEAQITSAVYSLGQMVDILGNHGTNLYTVKG